MATATGPVTVTFNEPAGGVAARGTAVLVHGTLDRAASFRRVARYLPDWSILGWDRRGWGSSRELGTEGVTLSDHVDDLCAILAETPNAVVVGHSYGGLIALCSAVRSPEHVRAVVAFEPPIRWLPWWPVEAPWEHIVRSARGPQEAAESLLRAILGEDGWARLHTSSQEKLLADGPVVLAEMNDPALNQQAFDPPEVRVPLVVAAGTETLPHHLEVSRRIAALVPNGEYVGVEGAGHTAHVSHPEEFARLVERAATLADSQPSLTH